MNEINEIKLPKGVESISVTQHDDKIVIEFIPEKPKFKRGDFVYEDGRIMIVKNYPDSYYALIYPKADMEPVYNWRYAPTMPLSSLSFRCATEDEKQLLIDALKKDGKRWNAERMKIEDIPQPRFKIGDKVKIKDGISSKTHRHIFPHFTELMDEFIGKELTVKGYNSSGWVVFYGCGLEYEYEFAEDWLEPYSEGLKKGDIAIFWMFDKTQAVVRLFDKEQGDISQIPIYVDNTGHWWANAIKFESKEQFEKLLRGEI